MLSLALEAGLANYAGFVLAWFVLALAFAFTFGLALV